MIERSNLPLLPLVFDAVTYCVGDETLLGPLDLEIEDANKTVILGPNGAGKSLLLRIAHGLLKPSAGEVRWASAPDESLHARQAMVFDHAVLLRRSARPARGSTFRVAPSSSSSSSSSSTIKPSSSSSSSSGELRSSGSPRSPPTSSS